MESSTTGGRTATETGFMSGYGMHVHALRERDVEEYKLDLGGHRLPDCIAVFGEDLAEGLAAVVDMRTRTVIWSDNASDAERQTPITPERETEFVSGLATMIELLFPQIEVPGSSTS